MLEGHPSISSFHLLQKKKGNRFIHYIRELRFLFSIQKKKYDVVFNLTKGDRGAIIAWASSALVKVGFDADGEGFWRKNTIFTHLVEAWRFPKHTVEKNLDALRILGFSLQDSEKKLFLHLSSTHELQEKRLLKQYGSYIVVHPGSRWMFKAIPPATLAEVISNLSKKGAAVVVTGSNAQEEVSYLEKMRGLIPDIPLEVLLGKTTLKELSAVIRSAKLLITPDSLPFHIASTFKTPVVGYFGPTSIENWGPWQHEKARVVHLDLPCRPCCRAGCSNSGISDCLDNLPAKKIIEEANALLETQERQALETSSDLC